MLADKHELLNRKIERVKDYRSPIETAKYFDLIDIPSFVNYLTRFGNNYNMVIDNSNYFKPIIKNNKYIQNWLNENYKFSKKKFKLENIFIDFNYFDILKDNLSSDDDIKKLFNSIINIDNFLNKNFILSVDNIKSGLYDYVSKVVNKANKELNKSKLEFKYTNSFHNLYYKKLPITVGLDFTINRNIINILLNITRSNLEILFYWKGGQKKLQ